MRVIEFDGFMKVPSKKNSMKFNTKTKRMYKPHDIRAFEEYLANLGMEEKRKWEQEHNQQWVMKGEYYLKVEVVYGDRRRRDVQNIFGSICDALNGVLYEDDCQIRRIAAQKHFSQGDWLFNIRLERE